MIFTAVCSFLLHFDSFNPYGCLIYNLGSVWKSFYESYSNTSSEKLNFVQLNVRGKP